MVTKVHLEGFPGPKHTLLLDLVGGFMGFCFGVLLNSVNEFPDSSVGKESACNAGDPVLISEMGRSPGEGKGYPLQYSGLKNSMDLYSPRGGKESHTT